MKSLHNGQPQVCGTSEAESVWRLSQGHCQGCKIWIPAVFLRKETYIVPQFIIFYSRRLTMIPSGRTFISFGRGKESAMRVWKGDCTNQNASPRQTWWCVKRYDLAAKCYRQALHCVKETPALGEREKASKTQEIQVLGLQPDDDHQLHGHHHQVKNQLSRLDCALSAGLVEGVADKGDWERPWWRRCCRRGC